MKHLTMGLMLFVLVSSTWAGTLKDNFDDGNANEWQMFGGKANNSPIDQSTQWVVEKGELVSISKDVCTWSSIFGLARIRGQIMSLNSDLELGIFSLLAVAI